jgi:hypothetical protein
MQQPVEERGEPVVAQGVRDLVKGEPGDVGAERLVEPEVGPGEEPQRHGGGENGGDQHGGEGARSCAAFEEAGHR